MSRYKFGRLVDGASVEHRYHDLYAVEPTTGPLRLKIGPAEDHAAPIVKLAESLSPPFGILYVLHTPRGDHESARYQSPALDWQQAGRVLCFVS